MIWASGWVWALAVAGTLPLVAHLWSRGRPAAVPFPTLRFLRAASPISRRLRRVQEWPLLLLRLAVVGAICAAAAGPTVDSHWRRQAWRERLHRVIVVDAGLATASTSAVVADLQRTASSSIVLGPADITDLFDDAIARAGGTAPRIRTELVAVWDGSRTALSATDVADVPAHVGMQLMVVNRPGAVPTARTDGIVVPVTIDLPPGDDALDGRLRAGLDTLLLPASVVPITARWSTRGAPQASRRVTKEGAAMPDGVLRALEDIVTDPRVREAAERSEGDPRAAAGAAPTPESMVLARGADGVPLLRGSSDGRGLILDFTATPRSPLTWWAIVSARESLARMEWASPGRWSPADLGAASRPAPLPPTPSLPGGLDTRACWGVALALLILEQIWRERRSAETTEGTTPTPSAASPREASDAA